MASLGPGVRIGVDMGGTNTDAVMLDLHRGIEKVVLASTKVSTTQDIAQGVRNAIENILGATPQIPRSSIQSVTIGTTHFVNALIQRSAEHLEQVASIRLCGPFSRLTPPFAGFPFELRELIEGPHFFVDGGLQIDGSEICSVNEAEIISVCEAIKEQGIRSVAICAVFAPIDFNIKHEDQVERIIKTHLPGVHTTCSHRVANIGLLERENATILNASLLTFALETVRGFHEAAKSLRLDCPFFVTGNDGTLLSLQHAAVLPIRTFSSGPTNSMRGASFLAHLADPSAKRQTALVVDIGGTTTEIGVLLPSGFPRQAASTHELCGVRLNFPMPHVLSIGLGGGSLVEKTTTSDKVFVGPKSVGYRIAQKALVFGGSETTATDIAVKARQINDVGDQAKVSHLDPVLVTKAIHRIDQMLEVALDSMKTSPQDIPVYLVGGGALLAPDTLRGVSKVYRFPYYQCANAVGAAIAQIGTTVDSIETTEGRNIREVQKEVDQMAINQALKAGAIEDTIKIVESEAIPIAYFNGRCRFFAKAAGDWSGDGWNASGGYLIPKDLSLEEHVPHSKAGGTSKDVDIYWTAKALKDYKPRISQGEWCLTELDLELICIGSYILGCGGGGDPYPTFLAARELLRQGATIRVVSLSSLSSNSLVGWGGSKGSPDVISERLVGSEYTEVLTQLLDFLKCPPLSALVAFEIGGSNGMVNLVTGASTGLNLPVLDGDFMGRAYPTTNVFDTSGTGAQNTLPTAIASGDGSVMFMTKSKDDRLFDTCMRAACVEMGTLVGQAHRPLSFDTCQTALIQHTISLSWRLGRAVSLANKEHNIANIGKILVDTMGGPGSARVLFSGKIVDLDRKTHKGHTVGELTIAALTRHELEDTNDETKFEGTVIIPFKNENLLCTHDLDGTQTVCDRQVIATVPDLICVLDAQNGHALGTPDYKFGRRVLVIGVTASTQWTSTERGLKMGDLRAFGIINTPYKPLGVYSQPRSVIDEYGGTL